MREIALLALILLPKWGIFNELRGVSSDYLKPKATIVSTENTDLEDSLSKINLGPIRLTDTDYTDTAKAVYMIDVSSNKVFSEHNASDRLEIASLTKLMTAYIILRENQNDLDKQITVPYFSVRAGDAVAGLRQGDVISLANVLDAALISSGSDAALTLAITNAGNVNNFVEKMNQAASDLNLSNTHYTNPVGWDDVGNYSSAKDIANLSRVLLGNDYFRETVALDSKAITTKAGRLISLVTTNKLLEQANYIGIKTGFTYGAGECLASLEKNDDKEILTVILGSRDRFAETKALNTWTKEHFLW